MCDGQASGRLATGPDMAYFCKMGRVDKTGKETSHRTSAMSCAPAGRAQTDKTSAAQDRALCDTRVSEPSASQKLIGKLLFSVDPLRANCTRH